MRGVREGNLDGLRKRISTLFLQYIKTPTFNPEAAKLLKVHTKFTHKNFRVQFHFFDEHNDEKKLVTLVTQKRYLFCFYTQGWLNKENYVLHSVCPFPLRCLKIPQPSARTSTSAPAATSTCLLPSLLCPPTPGLSASATNVRRSTTMLEPGRTTARTLTCSRCCDDPKRDTGMDPGLHSSYRLDLDRFFSILMITRFPLYEKFC